MANLSIPSLPGAGSRSPRSLLRRDRPGGETAQQSILRSIISPFQTVGEYERTVVTRFEPPTTARSFSALISAGPAAPAWSLTVLDDARPRLA